MLFHLASGASVGRVKGTLRIRTWLPTEEYRRFRRRDTTTRAPGGGPNPRPGTGIGMAGRPLTAINRIAAGGGNEEKRRVLDHHPCGGGGWAVVLVLFVLS